MCKLAEEKGERKEVARKAAQDFAMIENGTVVAKDKIKNLSDAIIFKHMAI